MDNVEINESTSITPQPGLDPSAQQAPEASPAASSVVDPSISLNQRLAAIEEENRHLKTGMNDAQRRAAEYQKSLRTVAPLIEYGQRDPNFMPYLFEQAKGYGSDNGQGSLDPAVLGVLNPIQQEVRELREQVEAKSFHEKMDALATEFPEVMTPEAKQRLATDAYGTGNYDLEFHFFKTFGKELLAKARSQGTQQAVKTIQQNNQLYATGATTTAVPPVSTPDFTKMSSDEKQAWIEKDTKRIWDDPDYMAKVAREIG